jgi:hypothetical protein
MAPSVEQSDVFNVVVLGAGMAIVVIVNLPYRPCISGVIGLTTAVELQERGKGRYRVTIVSDVFPGDPNTGVNYTSQWAVRCAPPSRTLPTGLI